MFRRALACARPRLRENRARDALDVFVAEAVSGAPVSVFWHCDSLLHHSNPVEQRHGLKVGGVLRAPFSRSCGAFAIKWKLTSREHC